MKRVSKSLQTLADILETVETDGTDETDETKFDIMSVNPHSDNILESDTIDAKIELRAPFLGPQPGNDNLELTTEDIQLTEDGSLHLEFVLAVSHDQSNDANLEQTNYQSEKRKDATVNVDGITEVTDSGIPKSESGQSNTESTPDENPEVPAYRNPDQLQEVYEAYDTFAEMTDALGVDVTPQTVRRYMIKYGIHEPTSNSGSQTVETLLNTDPDIVSKAGSKHPQQETERANGSVSASAQYTATDATVSTDGGGRLGDDDLPRASCVEQAEASTSTKISTKDSVISTVNTALPTSKPKNGSGETSYPIPDDVVAEIDADLPDHLTLDDVKATAERAKTLYEAQKHLDLDRNETRELLQDLNLLDLVHGRIATRDLTDRTIEDINRRLQSTTVSD